MRRERLIATASVTFDEVLENYGLKLEQIVEDTSQDDRLRELLDERLQVREKYSDRTVGDNVTVIIEKSNIF